MTLKLTVTTKDHIEGPTDAPIELIEYGDYQCSYCREAYYIVRDIQKELGNNLKFVFRNFPLTDLHPDALRAAMAAEAAAAQDKFWEMHDKLYENQDYLEDSYLIDYARQIDLNVEKFEEDFGKDKHTRKIEEDYESGLENGVDGTPAFFINGRAFEGNWMSPEFKEYLMSLMN